MQDHLMNTYNRLPVSFDHGDGAYLWDKAGKQYMDALCGISVTSLGHNHPAVTAAILDQAPRLLHTSNLYQVEHQQKLADLLCSAASMERAFIGNSGAEANEAAIKLARLYGHGRGIDKPDIIVMEGSFHGRTMATLSATGNRKVQAGFEPLVSGFVRAPYNNIEALEAIAANNKNVVAILLEPVQGEGGIVIPDKGYLRTIRQLCDDNGWLMMLDEIQTGMARSGKMFAFQHEAIQPDVLTLAKALGNGIPIGACLTGSGASDIFHPGNHGTTFGGNPFASRVACAVTQTMLEQKLADQAADIGDGLSEGLRSALDQHSVVRQVRNRGLLIGIELDADAPALPSIALDNGLLINVTAGNVIRLLPPLTLDQTQMDEIIERLVTSINRWLEA
jgi:acetylornithine aminotransferase